MADIRSMTNVDGVITPTADARVPVLDRGFLYGDSVYEVFRTYDGVPLFYDEHWARLQNSAALIRMQLGITKAELTSAIAATVAATGAKESRDDVYVRYTITRGGDGIDLFPSGDLRTRYVIIVRPVPNWPAELYSRGVRLAVAGTLRNPSSALDPNIKGGNYMNNVLGLMDAREVGADDCLMLNDAGFVTEASNSNAFFVIDGALVTPGQTAANLRGLTKAAVHEACRARGLASEERDVAAADLSRVTECFLTSATREVMPVASIRTLDGHVQRFPEGGGPITRRVAAYYKEYVADYVRTQQALSFFGN
jgi:branched-chain amino acid aminotransferase